MMSEFSVVEISPRLEKGGLLFRFIDRWRDSGDQKRLLMEFNAATRVEPSQGKYYERVPYPLGTGVVWRAAEKSVSMITGDEPNSRLVDCNAVFIAGSERNALMHVSPMTMVDEFVTKRVATPMRRDVPQQLNEMMEAVGKVEQVVIVAGDETLSRQLALFMTTGENAWDGDKPSHILDAEKLTIFRMGTVGKEFRYSGETGGILMANHTVGRIIALHWRGNDG